MGESLDGKILNLSGNPKTSERFSDRHPTHVLRYFLQPFLVFFHYVPVYCFLSEKLELGVRIGEFLRLDITTAADLFDFQVVVAISADQHVCRFAIRNGEQQRCVDSFAFLGPVCQSDGRVVE